MRLLQRLCKFLGTYFWWRLLLECFAITLFVWIGFAIGQFKAADNALAFVAGWFLVSWIRHEYAKWSIDNPGKKAWKVNIQCNGYHETLTIWAYEEEEAITKGIKEMIRLKKHLNIPVRQLRIASVNLA